MTITNLDGELIDDNVLTGCQGNQLILQPATDLSLLAGDTLIVTLSNVEDRFENRSISLGWDFVVGATYTAGENDDLDGDGVNDTGDHCALTATPNQRDRDEDSIGDLCDDDLDGDGIPNLEDNCPYINNPDQENVCASDDQDGDGIPNPEDNCPETSNAAQEDLDGDGIGDGCDDDIDGDGYLNTFDNCPLVQNIEQADSNGDGQGDACSPNAVGDPARKAFALNVSPNPTRHQLNIEMPGTSLQTQVSLYDLTGKKVSEWRVSANALEWVVLELPAGLAAGMYFVRANVGSVPYLAKVVVER